MLEQPTFRQAVWLFCPAFVLHVCEEYPGFTRWAKQHASARFTQREYNAIHVAGIAGSALSAALVWAFPNPVVVFLFFAFVFAPAALFNTLFHAGGSLVTKTYCPGAVTSVGIYLPLFVLITARIHKEAVLSTAGLCIAAAIAGIFHAWEVGHNVFKRW